MDDLLTVREAADRLERSVGRVRQILGDGRIKGSFKRGGAWWIPADGLDVFIAEDRDRRFKKKTPTE